MYVTASELLDIDFGETNLVVTAPDAVGREGGVIPADGITLLHGKRQSCKTHLMLTLAICLAQQAPLFGKYRTTKPCRSVIVQCDMPRGEQKERVVSSHRVHSRKILDNIMVALPGPTNIPALKEESELVEKIMGFEPDLVFWDALKRLHRMDPNLDQTASIVYNKLQSLMPGPTHVLGHHDRKTNTSKDAVVSTDEEFSGASGWIDMADTCIHTIKIGEGRIKLDFTKTRGAPHQDPISLHLDPSHLLMYAQTPIQHLVREWKKEHPKLINDKKALHHYLLSTFACTPKVAWTTVYGK